MGLDLSRLLTAIGRYAAGWGVDFEVDLRPPTGVYPEHEAGRGKTIRGQARTKQERSLTSYIEDLTFSKHVIFKDFFKVHGNAE